MLSDKERQLVLRNAAFNVLRGSSAAVVGLVLPPFLIRSLDRNTYGAWALVLQMSAYIANLDLGLQTAVSRFVAHATERKDNRYASEVVSSALLMLSVCGILAFTALSIWATFLPKMFPGIPTELQEPVRVALLLVSASLALGLPSSALSGVFAGLQRTEVPAFVTGGSRLVMAIAVVEVVRHGGRLRAMALCTAIVNVTSYLVQYGLFRQRVVGIAASFSAWSWDAIKELLGYCFSLMVWLLGLLLVNGMDLVIVSAVQFRQTAYYAVATSALTFLGGLYGALFSPMVPATAVLHARGDARGLGRTVVATTRYSTLLLLAMCLPPLIGAKWLLTWWVGPVYALNTTQILQVLIVANFIRLSFAVYALGLIGSGQQRLVTLMPVVEAITNLSASILLCRKFGAIGVAYGTLIGAVVMLLGNFLYNMPRTTEMKFTRSEFLFEGMLRPLTTATPLLAAWLVMALWRGTNEVGYAATFTAGTLGTCICVWLFGLSDDERIAVRVRLRRLVS